MPSAGEKKEIAIAALQEKRDLFRVESSKKVVDTTPNTIRVFIKEGLPCYRVGKKMVFVSISEFETFIRQRGVSSRRLSKGLKKAA
jgi:hypothetical protein